MNKEYVGITAEELTSLGFVLEDGVSNDEHKWWYYIMDIGSFCLLTDATEDIENTKFSVQLWDYNDEFVFTDYKDLKEFINNLKRNKK